MTRGSRAGVLAVLAVAGCSPSEVCSRDESPTSLESASFEGARVFANAGEREEIDLELTLDGLPELWSPEGAVESGRLSVTLAFAYDGVPVDGTTEVPSIRISFEHAEGSGASTPYASGLRIDGSTFSTCASSEARGCCEFGSASCTIRDRVTIERLQGTPYPPLDVSWELGASASINDCPFEKSAPELDLAVPPP